MKFNKIQKFAIKATAAAFFLSASHTSFAVRIALFEEQYPQGPIISDIRINDALGEIPKPHLKIYPDENEEHKQFVDILSAGMPFDMKNIRDQVAKVLQGFPDECKQHMGIVMIVGPIEHIDRFVPGVKDKRRILNLKIGNCLSKKLPQCSYDISEEGEMNFTLGMLMKTLEECRDATNLARQNGIELTNFQAQDSAKKNADGRGPQSVKTNHKPSAKPDPAPKSN